MGEVEALEPAEGGAALAGGADDFYGVEAVGGGGEKAVLGEVGGGGFAQVVAFSGGEGEESFRALASAFMESN